MARLTLKLTQTATKVTVTRNEYGDMVYGGTSSVPCLYRDISLINRGNANIEQQEIDGQIWFDADHEPKKGDIYQVDGNYYRIEKVVIARDRLRTNTIQFHKCEVTFQRQIS